VLRGGGGASGAAAAENRGGQRAQAQPDGEEQRAQCLGLLLHIALLRDEAPLSGDV
jgi:hypothetical protein